MDIDSIIELSNISIVSIHSLSPLDLLHEKNIASVLIFMKSLSIFILTVNSTSYDINISYQQVKNRHHLLWLDCRISPKLFCASVYHLLRDVFFRRFVKSMTIKKVGGVFARL